MTEQKVEKIWFNGKLVPWDEAKVHVLSHTLHYGVGVFEGIRCYKIDDKRSAVFRLEDHTKRLFHSAKIMLMDIPFSEEEINKAIIETLQANKIDEGYIRPIAIIGDGSIGVNPADNPVYVAIITIFWGTYLGEEALRKGVRVKTSSYTRHHINAAMTKGKVSGNYLNSVLAKREAIADGYDEALILDKEGYVAEASGENIFIVKNGVIYTPPRGSILPGITRDTIMILAKDLGYEVKEEYFTRDEIYTADEAFFTGTAAEVTPIRELDNRIIGNGTPGEITLKLQEKYFDLVRGKIEKYHSWLHFYEI